MINALLFVGGIGLFIVAFLWRRYKLPNLFNTGLTPWGNRTIRWLRALGTSGVEASGARFSDFVGLAGFSLSIVAIVLGWFSIVLQTKKAALEQETRDLTTKIAEKQRQIELNMNNLEKNRSGELIHLGAPQRDAQLIGTHVDLDWSYANPGPFLTYLVEIRNKEQSKPGFQRHSKTTCTLDQFQACKFVVTDPSGQHTQIFPSKSGELAGEYLWRVAPAQRATNYMNNFESDQIADWSQFRAFTIYPTIQDRIMRTRRVLVGTTYAEDARFSTLGAQGRPEGHDIDLIKLLIEGCLSTGGSNLWPRYDEQACFEAISRYERSSRYEPENRKGTLQVIVKPFPSISEGLNALSRREVDLFIGSLTKARKREHGPVRFTDGYYSFETRLYARDEGAQTSLLQWAAKKRTVGCINNSSNYWLATLLAGEDELKNQLTIITFDTFPEMESAFDRGEVDGVLLDDVLKDQLHEARSVDGIQDTMAWKTYHKDANTLGFPKEEFAIAVVLDVSHDEAEHPWSFLPWVKGLFETAEDNFATDNSLYAQLQRALRSKHVQEKLLPKLRSVYGIPNP